MNEETTAIKSSTFPNKEFEPVSDGTFITPTWILLGVLVVVLVIIKTFVYIKDPTRDNK
jgi:K+-transporting ATPase A subunit